MRESDSLGGSAKVLGVLRGMNVRAEMKGLMAGLIGGLVALSASISYPAIVFAGPLEPHLGLGIGLALFGTMVLAAVVAWGSSLPATIANSQLEASVILSIMAGPMLVALGPDAPDREVLGTLLLTIVLSSLSLGLFLLLMGLTRRGNLARYMPFPVIGGFFMYLVWLMLKGGMATMLGAPVTLQTAALLVQPDKLLLWLPGLLAACGLFAVQTVHRHLANVPIVVIGSVGLFWLVAWSASIPLAQLQAAGYLVPPIGGQSLWSPMVLLDLLAAADPRVALSQVPQLVVLWLLVTVSLLLSASSLEIATHTDVDLDRELKVTGVANLVCGLGGGLGGYVSPSASLLPHMLGVRSRMVGLVVTLMSAVALFLAAGALDYVPRLLLGLVLIYLGLEIAAELVLDRWSKMPRIDRALMVLVFVSLAVLGFLPGLAVGVVAGTAVFAYSYARIDLMRSVGSGARFHSNVYRPSGQLRVLAEHAGAIQVVLMEGYAFFGSAHNFQQRVKALLGAHDPAPVRFLILDLARVDGADSSALFAFTRLVQDAQEQGCEVLFAAVPERLSRALRAAGLAASAQADGGRPGRFAFTDLDHALEYVEDAILQGMGADVPPSGLDQLEAAYPAFGVRKQLLAYCESVSWAPGEIAMQEDGPSDALYFIQSGRLTAWRTVAEGGRIRLRTIVPGTVVGEVGFYLHTSRAATVIADHPSSAFRITAQALRRMQQDNPTLSSMFHRFMATIAAERAADNVRLLSSRRT
jgi:sulfate permease, SulP family